MNYSKSPVHLSQAVTRKRAYRFKQNCIRLVGRWSDTLRSSPSDSHWNGTLRYAAVIVVKSKSASSAGRGMVRAADLCCGRNPSSNFSATVIPMNTHELIPLMNFLRYLGQNRLASPRFGKLGWTFSSIKSPTTPNDSN